MLLRQHNPLIFRKFDLAGYCGGPKTSGKADQASATCRDQIAKTMGARGLGKRRKDVRRD
jgi:hypothetical protein